MSEQSGSESRFITNQGEPLSEVIKTTIGGTQQLHFLVGYFYFSGFEQVYRSIGIDTPMRILVGMEAEFGMGGTIREVLSRSFPGFGDAEFDFGFASHEMEQSRYARTLVEAINTTDLVDEPEREQSFRFFLEKIKNGSLNIRKTTESNHAKLYLFEYKKEFSAIARSKGSVITGSSNLTWSGLTNRHEVNVILRDAHDYADAEKIFNELWELSIPLVDEQTREQFFTTIAKSWVLQLPKPWLMFIRVLDEYFASSRIPVTLPDRITNGKYFSTTYQTDAIAQGLQALENHAGCIIADVVGLGKSVIASAIAYNRNLRTIVISPPHLEQQWDGYLLDFSISGEVYTSGKIDKALERSLQTPGKKLIIVDEAHRYRNELTQDYANLHRLCMGNEVLLLTATPFNNRPQDIFSLIKLFQIPAKATLQTVESLAAEMYALVQEYKKLSKDHKTEREQSVSPDVSLPGMDQISARIRLLLDPLVIRRTRIDLEHISAYKRDLAAKGISFPEVRDPEEIEYDLGSLSDLYITTLDQIAGETGFRAARYKPLTYLKPGLEQKYIDVYSGERNLMEQGQLNLALFMKRLLVRRFESSLHAFRKSVDSLASSCRNTLVWMDRFSRIPLYKRGTVPDAEALALRIDDRSSGLFDETLEDMLAGELAGDIEKGLSFIQAEDLSDSFRRDVESDLELLEQIRNSWSVEQIPDDPKFTRFSEVLSNAIAREKERKVIVFTEFSDTASYLVNGLVSLGFRVLGYSSDLASPTLKDAVRMNFDAGSSERKNDYDVLVATDAISEGFSLHRAGAIYNYDIPYNPTRVIQRVGRINRINQKVFDILYIYNFFPTMTGESVTGIRSISTFKIAMIQAIFGSDTKVLTADEKTGSWLSDQYRTAIKGDNTLSWDAEYRNILDEVTVQHPEELEAARSVPRRARIARAGSGGLLLFSKKGSDFRFVHTPLAESGLVVDAKPIGAEQAFSLLQCTRDEPAIETAEPFERLYREARKALESVPGAIPSDKLRQETLARLDLLERMITGDAPRQSYLRSVRTVIASLDSIPQGILREIKIIKPNNPEQAIRILENCLPRWYIAKIMDRVREISEKPHELILCEQWRQ